MHSLTLIKRNLTASSFIVLLSKRCLQQWESATTFLFSFFFLPPLGVCACHDMGCLPGADIVWCPTDILPVSRVSRWPAYALKATLAHYTVL